MKLAALIVYVLGFLCESAGGVSVFRTAHAARAMLKNPSSITVTPKPEDGLVLIDSPSVDGLLPAERLALTALAPRRWALVLLGVGIVCSFVGNLLSLC